jgi:Arc/MetJ-type ribon-helix-helix transcriptional regulator
MAEAKTEKTVAEELREAATALRDDAVPGGTLTLHDDLIDHGSTCESAVLTDAREGMDRLVLSGEWGSTESAFVRLAVALLNAREPLASWLETEAHMCEKRGNSSDGHTFHALAVARALNGSTS